MASIDNSVVSSKPFQPFEYETGVKVLADTSNIKAVPSKFNYTHDPTGLTADSLPIVDFSALATIADPDQRSRALQGLAKACQEWGFFILVNHGIAEELMNDVRSSTIEFFNLPESEKRQYEAKSSSDPIKFGNYNVLTTSNQAITLWRDYLYIYSHPNFHCPSKPLHLRNVLLQYTEKIRKLARELVEGVSETLELEKQYVNQALDLDSSFQMFVANLYPPCPQPDQAMGIPPHSDSGLFTFLIHNGVAGLQIQHDGKWFNVESPQSSILVNVADHLQIFSNGRYKSVKHRAVVNSERERISLVVGNGPSMEAVVGPAAPLVERDGRGLYRSLKYSEYLDSKLTKPRFDNKSILEQMMIHEE